MALRHPFPQFEVDPHKHLLEPERTPPRMQPPVEVEFRAGASLADVVAKILEHRSVVVNAAVGSGKSVRLPTELARATGGLVIHTVPSPLLARSLYDYVSTLGNVPVALVDSVEQQMPDEGVVFTSCACLVARLIGKSEAVPKPFTLFMDEWHESDGCTYSLRAVALCKPYIERLVLASATANPDGFRRREVAGSVRVQTYDARDTPDKWRVADSASPWGADNIMSHALLFVERDSDAIRLAADYRDYGFTCYRITSRTLPKEFSFIMAQMKDPSQGLIILLADYSFRSGYTMPIGLMIDGGQVAFVKVEEGQAHRHYRSTFLGEQEQAIGRVGRVVGSQGVAYVPAGDRAFQMCELEGVEADAAALLMRYLGHKPSSGLQMSPYARGDVPKDLVSALNSGVPLRLLPHMQLAEWPGLVPREDKDSISVISRVSTPTITAPVPAFPFSVSAVSAPVDRVEMLAVQSPVADSSAVDVASSEDYGSTAVSEPAQVAPIIAGQFIDVLRSLQVESQELELGKYYYYPGVASEVCGNAVSFPDGLVSVMRMVSDSTFEQVAVGLSQDDKDFALTKLLSAYNDAVADTVAIRKLLVGMTSLQNDMVPVVDKSALREWLVRLAEVLTMRGAQMSTYVRALVILADGKFEEMFGMDELEREYVQTYVAELTRCVRDKSVVSKDAYRKSLVASARPKSLLANTRFGAIGAGQGPSGLIGTSCDRKSWSDVCVTRDTRVTIRRDSYAGGDMPVLWRKFKDKIADMGLS